MTRTRLWLLTAAAFLLTGGLYAAFQTPTPAPDLAAWAPGGALLSIEAQDFSALLHDWSTSPEESAWLHSDNYAVFSRSHLFGRLQDAQKEFASAAGLPVDTALLQQLAGHQTFFAWYDIGQLQLLYITRMAPGTAAQNPLLTHRNQFQTRQAGGITFYVKTSTAETTETDTTDDTSTDPADTSTAESESRTVAFAISGDYLILATGEDLIAHTLELITAKPTDDNLATSLAHQPWYQDALAKAPANPGELRMALHLEAIVKTPQFRSYWVQQNITELKQYTAALTDLYRDPTGPSSFNLREERILLPKPNPDPSPLEADLAQLTALVPAHTVIYRAAAHPSPADTLAALNDKLLLHALSPTYDTTTAPTTDLATPQPGTPTDLETRIDDPTADPIAVTTAADSTSLLHTLLTTTPIDALLTLDRNPDRNPNRNPNRNDTQTTPTSLWTPFTSAVILHSTQPWNPTTLQQALTQALQQHLSTSTLGVQWQQHTTNGQTYFSTSDAAPILLAIHNQTCILTDDEPLLLDILHNLQTIPTPKPQPSLLMAGFDHTAAQPAFAHWTATIDGLHQPSTTPNPNQTPNQQLDTTPTHEPAFFAENLQSLSHAFTPMTHETFTAHHDGTLLHQTITYTFTP